MKKILFYILLSLFFAFSASTFAATPINKSVTMTTSIAPMLTHVAPAVVNITVEKENNRLTNTNVNQNKSPIKGVAVGSGVIINTKLGYIVTNAHVVDNQKVIIATLKDGRRYHAHIVGKDDNYDIAVIQIKADNLTAMHFANSDLLKVGDFAVAIGSPFGLNQTVTSGMISALNRTNPKIEGYQDFIQTDAPINPGNSGGALINMDGKLIGINTAIMTPTDASAGIGFSIPSNMVQSVAMQLIKYGKVTPGILGVVAQNITPELSQALHLKNKKGVIVTQVIPNSAAQKAGLKAEDIIIIVNNTPIHSNAQLRNMMGLTRPGTKIKISLLRNHQQQTITATVGDPKVLSKEQENPFLAGLRLQNFTDLEPDGSVLSGIIVLDSRDNNSATLAGLLPGDVILTANGHAVKSVQQLIHSTEKNPPYLLLKISRSNTNLFLVIKRNA